MGRRKAGMCKCGHELKKFHDERGVCTYGAGAAFGESCVQQYGGPCAKPRRNKMSDPVRELGHLIEQAGGKLTVKTRPVTVNGDAVLGALDAVIRALQTLRVELVRGKTSEMPSLLSGADIGEKQTATQTTRPGAAVATPSRRAEAPKSAAPFAGIGMSRLHRALLTVLAQHKDGMSKSRALVHAGYRSSGDVSSAWAELRRDGLIDGDSVAVFITEEGLRVLGPFTPLPKGAALRASVLASPKLKPVERAILQYVCDAYPSAIAKGKILDLANYASSGDTSSAFARLVKFGYATKAAHGQLRASEDLFE